MLAINNTMLSFSTLDGFVDHVGGSFNSLLPFVRPGEGPQDPNPLSSSDNSLSPGGTETVLVVEDEELVSAHIVRLLTRKGYHVLRANRPSEALQLLDAHADIALVLTDVVMPEMNGRELVTQIQERRPGMKAIFMSGYPQEIISQKGVLDVGIEFIPKPFHSAALCQKIRDVLDK